MGYKDNEWDDDKWDYQELTERAKENGGPEKYLDDIYDEGHADGRFEGQIEGGAYAIVAMAAIGAVTFATSKIRNYFKKRAEKNKEELHKKYNVESNKIDAYCSSCGKITCFCFDRAGWKCQSCGECNSKVKHRDSEEAHVEE